MPLIPNPFSSLQTRKIIQSNVKDLLGTSHINSTSGLIGLAIKQPDHPFQEVPVNNLLVKCAQLYCVYSLNGKIVTLTHLPPQNNPDQAVTQIAVCMEPPYLQQVVKIFAGVPDILLGSFREYNTALCRQMENMNLGKMTVASL